MYNVHVAQVFSVCIRENELTMSSLPARSGWSIRRPRQSMTSILKVLTRTGMDWCLGRRLEGSSWPPTSLPPSWPMCGELDWDGGSLAWGGGSLDWGGGSLAWGGGSLDWGGGVIGLGVGVIVLGWGVIGLSCFGATQQCDGLHVCACVGVNIIVMNNEDTLDKQDVARYNPRNQETFFFFEGVWI